MRLIPLSPRNLEKRKWGNECGCLYVNTLSSLPTCYKGSIIHIYTSDLCYIAPILNCKMEQESGTHVGPICQFWDSCNWDKDHLVVLPSWWHPGSSSLSPWTPGLQRCPRDKQIPGEEFQTQTIYWILHLPKHNSWQSKNKKSYLSKLPPLKNLKCIPSPIHNYCILNF